MADLDQKTYARVRPATAGTAVQEIDEGLRAYMIRVYNYMAAGLALTGAAAIGTYSFAVQTTPAGRQLTEFGQFLFASPAKWVIFLAPIALVFFLAARVDRMSVSAAQTTFWVYAGLVGVSLASLGLVYSGQSIARVFFITSAAFGALSLWGYTTKRDLSGWGSFLFMGLIGILIASVVNIWLASSALQWVVSVIGVLVFSGLTAYDTQRIKELYYQADSEVTLGRMAIMGALSLYLDFINLFVMLLNLFGNRE
jgi:FtsH-binding integral membrane protein